MSRAALLPFTGDPFLLKEWLRCFGNWKDEISTLYLLNNSDTPEYVQQYCWQLTFPFLNTFKIYNMSEDRNIDHGPAINKMLDRCEEDLIMLIEEDAFIFKRGEVDRCFQYIESENLDMVGSERGSTAEELIQAGKREFGIDEPFAFWPNFFFCRRKDLLKTDHQFQAHTWYKGDYIKELDHTVEADIVAADTFVWTSLQLRDMGLRAKLIPQYHSVVEDIQDKVQIKGIFDRVCPWIHIGSLSGWQNVLFSAILPPRLGEVEEWERRASFWLMCWEDAQQDLPEYMEEFSDKYKKGIDRLITEYTLSPARVSERAQLYRYLLNPELFVKKEAERQHI